MLDFQGCQIVLVKYHILKFAPTISKSVISISSYFLDVAPSTLLMQINHSIFYAQTINLFLFSRSAEVFKYLNLRCFILDFES